MCPRLFRGDFPGGRSTSQLAFLTSPLLPLKLQRTPLTSLRPIQNPEQAMNSNLPPLTDSVTGNSQWAIAYSYFANGNLQSKTNARNITTSYT
jgi:YD repeat-containing protein